MCVSIVWAFLISVWCMGRHEWQRGNWITSSSLLTHSIWPFMSIIYLFLIIILNIPLLSHLFDMKTKIFTHFFYDHKYRISVRYFLILIFSISFFPCFFNREEWICVFFQCHLIRDILDQPTQRRRESMREMLHISKKKSS